MTDIRAAADRLLTEVANHHFIMQHAHDPDLRFATDIESVARYALESEGHLKIATDALRDIGGRDILRASEIAWDALEQIEGSDEVIGEALERQRQPENQPSAAEHED